jgi:CheY-like chemotaxis protein
MPRLSGHEAAVRFRESDWGSAVILIAVTGSGQEEDRRRSLEAGFDAHLLKPVDHAVLFRLLAGLRAKARPRFRKR